jgi:2-C-methyl-D-erythritol 2,4-cyclodiphosphate synthase
MRIGFGYDIHPLVAGRPLILGGVRISFSKGLRGHSDADVLCHAVSDALLGAASLGDIGEHFPDTDPKFKNANSLNLLNIVGYKLKEAGYTIVNVDSTIVAEAPTLSIYKSDMIKNIANALDIQTKNVSVKAKTNEQFDSTGHGDAVMAFAVASIMDTR